MIWSFENVILSIITTFILVLPVGYTVTLYMGKGKKSSKQNFFVMLPVYIAVGLACWGPLIFFTSLLHLSSTIILLVWIASVIVILALFRSRIGGLGRIRVSITRSGMLNSAVVMALFILSIFIFGRIAYLMKWSPPGDPVTHTVITSIILDQGKYPVDRSDAVKSIGTSSIGGYVYPSFAVLSAGISMITGLYPGQSLLVLAACISTLIPLLIYSIVYTGTGVKFYALLAFLMVYTIPGGFTTDPTHHILSSNLINGTYPCHFGNLLFILMFYFVITGRLNQLSFWTLAVSTYFTYRFYAPLILLCLTVYIVYGFIKRYREASSRPRVLLRIIRENIASVILITSVMLLLLTPNLFTSNIGVDIQEPIRIFLNLYTSHSYLAVHDKPLAMAEFPNILAPTASMILIIVLIIRRKKPRLSILYVLMFPLFMLSLNGWFFDNLTFLIGPGRTFPAFTALSHIVFTASLSTLCSNLPADLKNKTWLAPLRLVKTSSSLTTRIRSMFFFKIIVYLALFLLFFTGLEAYMNYQPSTWGRPVGSDYNALKWISENVPREDLILNDRSYTGLYLVSFSAKKAVNFRYGWRDSEHVKLMKECNQIFDEPDNYTRIRETILKWNIKYIYISAENGYIDFEYVPCEYGYCAQSGGYQFKDSGKDIELFDKNPFLQVAFREGNSVVYKTYPS